MLRWMEGALNKDTRVVDRSKLAKKIARREATFANARPGPAAGRYPQDHGPAACHDVSALFRRRNRLMNPERMERGSVKPGDFRPAGEPGAPCWHPGERAVWSVPRPGRSRGQRRRKAASPAPASLPRPCKPSLGNSSSRPFVADSFCARGKIGPAAATAGDSSTRRIGSRIRSAICRATWWRIIDDLAEGQDAYAGPRFPAENYLAARHAD